MSFGERFVLRKMAMIALVAMVLCVQADETGENPGPETPVISPVSGTVFTNSLTVNISCATAGATIHFTTNGLTPTAESPVYTRFKVHNRATVKAIACDENGATSQVATVEYALGRCADPVVSPTNGASFRLSNQEVSIAWNDVDGVLRYTLDGSEPTADSPAYSGPFTISETTTIKAKVFGVSYFDSGVVSATVTKIWSIGDALNVPGQVFSTDDATGWGRDGIVSKDGLESMRSGAIGNSEKGYAESTLSTTVSGKGTYSFWWKCSCEHDIDGVFEWDHAEFRVDGEVVARIDGETDWTQVSHEITDNDRHTLSWNYLKDDFGSDGDDCVWVDMVSMPAVEGYTQETAVPVPYAWIREKFPDVGSASTDFEAKAQAPAANGRKVWECYVAGLEPNVSTDELKVEIALVDGQVRISWTPNLNTGAVTRIYKVLGRTDLDKGFWQTPVRTWHRFFKVTVSMPTGTDGETTAVSGEGFVPTEAPKPIGVQLWENGPYWAEFNVGAVAPEEFGYYFWWGDTVGYAREGGIWMLDYFYTEVTWVSSLGTRMKVSPFSSSVCPTYGKDATALEEEGYVDSMGNLASTHDAATTHFGAPWRMPTDAEFGALFSKCTTIWTTTNGVYGRLVSGKGAYASKSIFLPAAGDARDNYDFDLAYPGTRGYYWSSTPYWGHSSYANSFYFYSNGFRQDDYYRYRGMPVRPVRDVTP